MKQSSYTIVLIQNNMVYRIQDMRLIPLPKPHLLLSKRVPIIVIINQNDISLARKSLPNLTSFELYRFQNQQKKLFQRFQNTFFSSDAQGISTITTTIHDQSFTYHQLDLLESNGFLIKSLYTAHYFDAVLSLQNHKKKLDKARQTSDNATESKQPCQTTSGTTIITTLLSTPGKTRYTILHKNHLHDGGFWETNYEAPNNQSTTEEQQLKTLMLHLEQSDGIHTKQIFHFQNSQEFYKQNGWEKSFNEIRKNLISYQTPRTKKKFNYQIYFQKFDDFLDHNKKPIYASIGFLFATFIGYFGFQYQRASNTYEETMGKAKSILQDINSPYSLSQSLFLLRHQGNLFQDLANLALLKTHIMYQSISWQQSPETVTIKAEFLEPLQTSQAKFNKKQKDILTVLQEQNPSSTCKLFKTNENTRFKIMYSKVDHFIHKNSHKMKVMNGPNASKQLDDIESSDLW